MTNDELKKKILTIVRGAMLEADELPFIETTDNIADALIAAGIGDVSKWKAYAKVHRIVITKDDKIKQLYSDEEVDKIVSERAEYKRRAEIAERAIELMARGECTFASPEFYKEQAEKELAEERKDD